MHQRPKYCVRIDNVYFLNHLGPSLRKATADLPEDELPVEIRLALRRLARRELVQKVMREPGGDPAA